MHKEQFDKLLKRILDLLEKTIAVLKFKSLKESRSERKIRMINFMSEYLQLYLLLRNEPNLKLTSEYKDFIEQSQYLLKGLVFELDDYVSEIEDRLRTTFYDNEWADIICLRRSAVEAVKEMYRGTAFEEFYEGENPEALILDTEDLDDSLEIQGGKRGGLKEEDIPREIPASHWWWWSPDEPPSTTTL